MSTTGRDIDGDSLLADIERLAGFGALPGGGLHRRSFDPPWREACAWLAGRLREAGMSAHMDAAGNVVGRLGPARGPALVIGSHLDTVPAGGHLDGAYGVLAGLACARALAGGELPMALEVVAFADEEGGWLDELGARAFCGDLTATALAEVRDADGRRLDDAMRECGLAPERIAEAARDPGDLHACLELHIEQGPVLESRGVPVGVVEGIVGIAHTDYRFRGRADHAGTTPMDTRRDALRAAAAFVTAAYAALPALASPSTRLTYGHLQVQPNATNVVPAEVLLREEIRDLDDDRLASLRDRLHALARSTASSHDLDVAVHAHDIGAGARMDEELMRRIEAACETLGLESLRMPSGAGHDAQVLARVCPAGMIFVPSRGGASHRPDEWTDPAALVDGARVLLRVAEGLLRGA